MASATTLSQCRGKECPNQRLTCQPTSSTGEPRPDGDSCADGWPSHRTCWRLCMAPGTCWHHSKFCLESPSLREVYRHKHFENNWHKSANLLVSYLCVKTIKVTKEHDRSPVMAGQHSMANYFCLVLCSVWSVSLIILSLSCTQLLWKCVCKYSLK